MVLALILIHVGRVAVRKAEEDAQKHKRALAFFLIGTLAILSSIPWPWLAYGRRLLPF
jgi:hypothetical protein